MIYCFDLDGTLCETRGCEYDAATPKRDVIERVNALHRAGHRIVIDSARGSVLGINWRSLTLDQLETWGVEYDTLHVGQKVYADVYVDDKAVAVGDWMAR